MELKFRDLKEDEIELRVGVVKEKGFTLLLYKNARVDMALLDEVVGVGNWQREHKILGNDIYCRVGIYNKELGQWVWREDAGAEANTEVEKSKASDSFKRACVNFGLGRCLYSAPFVWVSNSETENKNERYYVKEIEYVEHKISKLVICNEKTDKVVYSYGANKKVAQNVQNEPKNTNEERGSIDKNDLVYIQAFVNTMTQEQSRTNFYNRMEKVYHTMNPEFLTLSQGKELVGKLKNGR